MNKKIINASFVIAMLLFVAICCPISVTLKWILGVMLYLVLGFLIAIGLVTQIDGFYSAPKKSRITFFVAFSIFWPLLTLASFFSGLIRDLRKLFKDYNHE